MDNESIENIKEIFNLTNYDAKTYLGLLKLKEANVSKLIELTNVPRGKIYESIKVLQKKYLINYVPFSHPKKYYVILPEEKAALFVKEKVNSLKKKSEWFSLLTSEFEKKVVEGEKKHLIEIIKGRETEYLYYDFIKERARKYIHAGTTPSGLKTYYFYELETESFRKIFKLHNIVTKIVVPSSKETKKYVKKMNKFGCFEIREIENKYFFNSFIADDYYSLISLGFLDNAKKEETNVIAIYSESRQLATMLNAAFTFLWNNGRVVR